MAITGNNFEIRMYPRQGSLRPYVRDGRGQLVENQSLAGQIVWQAVQSHPPFKLNQHPDIAVHQSPDGFGMHCVVNNVRPTDKLVRQVTSELSIRHFAASIDLAEGETPEDSLFGASSLEALPAQGRYPQPNEPTTHGTVYDHQGYFGIFTPRGTVRVSVCAPRLENAVRVLSAMAGIAI